MLLIVEDDAHYARMLLGLARDKGFKGISAPAEHAALSLARQYQPTAISLDIFLPDMLGWTVLNHLKLDPVDAAHSGADRHPGGRTAARPGPWRILLSRQASDDRRSGNRFDRLKDFISPRTKRLLIVEDNDIERQSIVELLDHDDIELVPVASGAEALEAMQERPFDCVVLDLRLPDMSGFELLEKMQADPSLSKVPVVVFTGKDLSAGGTVASSSRWPRASCSKMSNRPSGCWMKLRCSCIALSPICRPEAGDARKAARLEGDPATPQGSVVDDDARNIFALTSLLENHEMDVLSTTNGQDAIELIETTPDISLVLMDIMMPEMDGYETIRRDSRRARSSARCQFSR